ncbi:MAG: homeobox domain-containing protein [Clostridia bacterium]|nr:homeobox domain-containing protein [Clostridia bacterium]
MGGKYFFDRYTPQERKELAEECGLTEEEIQVFDVRARKDRVIGTATNICISDTTVKRRSRSIAQKLARCGHSRHLSESMMKENCI